MRIRLLLAVFILSFSVTLAAADSRFSIYNRMKAAGLSEIPIGEWPNFLPGEGVLASPRLEAKHGASDVKPEEFARVPGIHIRHVEKIAAGQYRIIWDQLPIFLPRVRWKLELEQVKFMRQALSDWGELRPSGLAVAEDLPLPSDDPMAANQNQHKLLRTYEFQAELFKRANRKPWTIVIMDSGCRVDRDCPSLDIRSKSFVEGSAESGDQQVNQDRSSHGTRVTEIAAGIWNNRFGGHGIANVKQVLMLKVLFGFPIGGDYKAVGSEVDMIRAGEYLKVVLAPGEKAVVNISWSLLAAFWGFEDIMRSMDDRVLFVTSAGNIGQDANPNPQVPCIFELPNNACTTGVEMDGTLRAAAKRGSEVRLATLGGGVVTSFGPGNGTSYAVPQTVGTAAELGGESVNLKPKDLLIFMRDGGVPVRGGDNTFGIMRADPLGALAKIRQVYPLTPLAPPPVANKVPVVELKCDAAEVISGRPVSCTARASDPDGDRLTYRWLPQGRFTLYEELGRVIFNTDGLNSIPGKPSIRVDIGVYINDGRGGEASMMQSIVIHAPVVGNSHFHRPHRSRSRR